MSWWRYHHSVLYWMQTCPPSGLVMFVLILADLTLLEGRPFGAPRAACESLRPGHGTPQLTGSSPYNLDVGGVSSYSPGDTIKVTITGRDFEGFIVQARRADGRSTVPVGTFKQPPPYSKYLDCSKNNDTVTHANPSPKWNMPFSWVAPAESASDVIFIATIALEKTTYWMNVTSQPLAATNYPTKGPDVVSSATPVVRLSTTGANLNPTLSPESTLSRAVTGQSGNDHTFPNQTSVSPERKQMSKTLSSGTTPEYVVEGAPTVTSGTGIGLQHLGLIYIVGNALTARVGLL